MTINVSVYAKLSHDTARDLRAISLLASFPTGLLVHPSGAARSVSELVALTKSRPGQFTYAWAGAGRTTHLFAGRLLRLHTRVKLVQVPDKGRERAIVGLISGQVRRYFGSAPASLPLVRAGKLRALSVTRLERSGAAPAIPMMAKSGLPGFDAFTWIGMVAPAGVPRAIGQRRYSEVFVIPGNIEWKERIESLSADLKTSTPDALAAYIRSEITKWSKVVREAGIATQQKRERRASTWQ